MAMKEALEAAMHSGSAEAAVSALQANGAALATEDTMTQAVHDVYCGIIVSSVASAAPFAWSAETAASALPLCIAASRASFIAMGDTSALKPTHMRAG